MPKSFTSRLNLSAPKRDSIYHNGAKLVESMVATLESKFGKLPVTEGVFNLSGKGDGVNIGKALSIQTNSPEQAEQVAGFVKERIIETRERNFQTVSKSRGLEEAESYRDGSPVLPLPEVNSKNAVIVPAKALLPNAIWEDTPLDQGISKYK